MSEIIPVNGVTDIPSGHDNSASSSSFGDLLSGAASSIGGMIGDVTGGGLGMSSEMFTLLEKQMEMQAEMQTVSMISNIDKSRHESKMAAIRNIRSS